MDERHNRAAERAGPRVAGTLTILVLLLAASPPAEASSAFQWGQPRFAGVQGAPQQEDAQFELRLDMVESQIRERGIDSDSLLRAFGDVPRHEFVPPSQRTRAYADEPVPIRDPSESAGGESLSQPYLSARMIELLELSPDDVVLEIGTGSGYDSALMSRLASKVFTVEIDPRLAGEAKDRLERLGYDNVSVLVGNGLDGWPEHAPYDAILVTAAPSKVPEQLLEQLRIGGRLVVPVGDFVQELLVIERTPEGGQRRTIMPIRVGSLVEPED